MKINLNSAKKFTLAVLVGCLSFNVMATDNADKKEEASISLEPSKNSATVLVRFLNISISTPATIKVLDQSGDAIYKETLEGRENHAKKYNFSKLKPGKYSIVLKSETGEIRKPFIVGLNGTVREVKSEVFRQFRPAIIEKHEIDQVYIMFANTTGEPLSVKLIDRKGNILYEEEVQKNQNFGKVINLKDLPSGHYTVGVACEEYLYNYQKEIHKL